MKNLPLCILAFGLVLAAIGCGDSPPPSNDFSIRVVIAETRLSAGMKATAKAQRVKKDGRVEDFDAATSRQWSSSDPQVASIEPQADGTASVTGNKAGNVVIKVTVDGISGETPLEVLAPRLVTLQVTPAQSTALIGGTQRFTAQGRYNDGTTAFVTSGVTWSSNNPSIATVSSTGLGTGVAAGGPVTITASVDGVIGTAQFTITDPTPPALTSITLTPATASVIEGATQQFAAQGRFNDGSSSDVTSRVTWTSSNTAIATVSATGLGTGVKVGGPVTVTATLGGVSATARFTITTPPPVLTTITVTPATASVVAGSTRQFSAQGLYSDGSTLDVTSSATWTSNNTAVATVNASGLSTGMTPGGPVTLTASQGSVSGTAQLRVSGWTSAGSLSTRRSNHTATRLDSGKVLVVGGRDGAAPLYSVELYDPATSAWSPVQALATSRYAHAAVLLPSGYVFVTGGTGAMSSAELYIPETNEWFPGGLMSVGRSSHTMTLLPTGLVVVAGGTDGTSAVTSVEVFDSAANTWVAPSNLNTARFNHTATLLSSGKVLVTGGTNGSGRLNSAELYDPSTRTWTTAGAMLRSRALHTATLLASGKVLVSGGQVLTETASSELYDPATNTWSTAGSMAEGRARHTATLLSSGQVLVAGGNGSAFLKAVELTNPATSSSSATASMIAVRASHTATLLTSGRVLVVGGEDGTRSLGSAELYVP